MFQTLYNLIPDPILSFPGHWYFIFGLLCLAVSFILARLVGKDRVARSVKIQWVIAIAYLIGIISVVLPVIRSAVVECVEIGGTLNFGHGRYGLDCFDAEGKEIYIDR